MLCLKDGTDRILREHLASLQHGEEKAQIIETALTFIRNDIAMFDLGPKSYPTRKSTTDIEKQLKIVPANLQMFLRPILKTDERVAVWGQNFIKACRPKSGMLPYQMGIAVQLSHQFGSKWMLHKLHLLGYTESYSEIQNYKYSYLNSRGENDVSSTTNDVLETIVEGIPDQNDGETEVDAALGDKLYWRKSTKVECQLTIM